MERPVRGREVRARGARTFGCEMQQDGKAVSILMTRAKKRPAVPQQQEQEQKKKL